jgi:hypothetical protein
MNVKDMYGYDVYEAWEISLFRIRGKKKQKTLLRRLQTEAATKPYCAKALAIVAQAKLMGVNVFV